MWPSLHLLLYPREKTRQSAPCTRIPVLDVLGLWNNVDQVRRIRPVGTDHLKRPGDVAAYVTTYAYRRRYTIRYTTAGRRAVAMASEISIPTSAPSEATRVILSYQVVSGHPMDRFHPPINQRATDGSASGGAIDPLNSPFQWLGGRRYFTHAPYLLPYDDGEFTRLDFEHHLIRQAFKSNVLAPVGQPHVILDVGIGTGRWALEVASQFPSATVVGMDLMRPPTIERTVEELRRAAWGQAQTPAAGQMSNFTFVAANILSRLPFPDGAFDYVHMRFLSAAISLSHWRQVMYELVRITRRGGWIEVVDTSWTPLNSGPATEQLFHWARIAGMIHEINLELAAWIGSLFLDSGLANVTAPRLQLPMGRAGGRIGSMVAANAIAVAEAIQPWVISYGIAPAEAFASALEEARTEVTEGSACAYPIFVAYGQRL